MAKVVAAKDWSQTPLGPIESWPQSLRTTVSLCLASNFPISLAWGPDRIQIYNDGYWPICGAKHPHSMGQDFRQCWVSAWPAVGEAFESAEKGATSYLENQRMFLDRNGYLEETFFTFSFSPIRDESGEIGGLFHPVTETTATMLSERRTKALRDLASRTAKAASVEEACRIASEVMTEAELDLPFALLYLLDEAGEALHLHGSAGIQPDCAAGPARITLAEADAVWPLGQVLASGQSQIVEHFSQRLGLTSCGPYPEPPVKALVLPLPRPGLNRLAGVLVAGVSFRLPLNEAYTAFYDLLAGHLASAIANARAYAEERRRAEALAELDRAKTQFFSNVSHEFRTPLTLMLGPLNDFLERPGQILTASRAELELVHRNGLRLLRLVNSLLDFSRIEAGRARAAFEPVDLAAYTKDLSSVFRSAMEKAGIAFVVDCPPLSRPVYVDRSMWEKVILNLLSNAFKFTFSGEIRVQLRDAGNAAELSVSDTGAGIPAAAIPRLFDRFYRVEGARGRTFEGSGIGLSLVREVVKLHAGSLEVESQVGVGSAFRVSLPFGKEHIPARQLRVAGLGSTDPDPVAAQAYVEEALRWLPSVRASDLPDESRAPVPPGESRPRVLLADDNADMRQYVESLLSANYDVVSVSNGAEALRAILDRPPDLVLTDVMMPELDGFGLLLALRQNERTRGIPVVMLSARAGEEARVEGIHAGADDYLVKPFAAKELLARVQTNLELNRLRSEIARQDELRRAAAALEQHHRLLDAALSSTLDFVYIFDRNGRFTYANRALLTLWQKPLEDVVGKMFVDLGYSLELSKRLQWQIRRVIDTRQPVRDETSFPGPHGETRSYDYIFVPVVDQHGNVDAVAGSTRDITERVKAEAEERERQDRLRESARLESLGLLAGGVAHDFNNLLVGVIGNTSLAQEMLPPDHPAGELLGSVLKTGEQAAHLTRQMLAYSGRGKFAMEILDLSLLIADMVGLVRPSIAKKISLRLELTEDLPPVEVDRGQVQQVFMNLALNAADAIGSHEGRITIRTSVLEVDEQYLQLHQDVAVPHPGQYVSLEVHDTGCGMDDAVKAKIFEPFFSTKFVGRGLGLAAVAGIVRGHKGAIAVASAPGKGSCFTVLFPAAPQAARNPTLMAPIAALQGTGTVLVVDDETTVSAMAKKALERYGYTVLLADSGPEAIHIAKRHPGEIALVVLDMSMPDMSGEEVLPELRKIRPQIKVLVSSGYSESETLPLFGRQRVTGFIQKPYTSKGLAEKVKSCLA